MRGQDMRHRIAPAILACGGSLVVPLALGACRNVAASEGPAAEIAVTVEEASVADVEETTDLVARLVSRKSIVVQPRTQAHVRRILVGPGQRVVAGTPLLELDADQQRAELSSANATRAVAAADVTRMEAQLTSLVAQRAAAEARTKLAANELDRARSLRGSGSIAENTLDEAERAERVERSGLASLDAQIEAQRAALAGGKRSVEQASANAVERKVEVGYGTLAAPFDGIVGDVPVKVGELVTPATRLTTLDDPSALEAYVDVPATRASELSDETAVRISDGAGREVVDGRPFFVAPRADEETQTVLAKVAFDNSRGVFRSGQFGRARVVWRRAPYPIVPVSAVRSITAKSFLFVVENEGGASVAHQRSVTLGPPLGDRVPVLSGVKRGERVVVSGAGRLNDGARVNLGAKPGA